MTRPADEDPYARSGVSYADLDPAKVSAQALARQTAGNIVRFGRFKEVEWSRGESAYLIDMGEFYLALVEEGLGTKNLVADAMIREAGQYHYREIAQDAVAMIVNDMITLGAEPMTIAMHLAIGASSWLQDERRQHELFEGWRNACNLAGCTWGPGETATIWDIVAPDASVISGSAVGIVRNKEQVLNPMKIRNGDAIILLHGSGIHANGLTLVRDIASALPEGYRTLLPDGRTYGDALLDPTPIYVPLIAECLAQGVDLHYGVNITGHGFRKLLRAPQPFEYVIEHLPPRQPIFDFIQEHGKVSDRHAYGNYNMGAGFALYLPEGEVTKVERVFDSMETWARPPGMTVAGRVSTAPEKKVIIAQADVTFTAEDLQVR